MNRFIVGIDTSHYCTSICLLTEAGDILAEARRWLPVPKGERGIRQSEGVFHHVRQLTQLWCDTKLSQGWRLAAVCASRAPRPVQGSYMPVFVVGTDWGRSLAHLAGVPFYETTHQEGHIAAALLTADRPVQSRTFTVVHLSGGTSDILRVDKHALGYAIETVGGTCDLYAGQLVDRIGVALGLTFPAGKELEQLASQSVELLSFPTAVNGMRFSFSGPEGAIKRALQSDRYSGPTIARAVEHVIAKTVEKALLNGFRAGVPKRVLFVGGVAANAYIRRRLRHRLEHRAVGATLSFADVRYSGDNAYGVAALGWEHHRRRCS